MNDPLRYRLIDEPRPGPLRRFALPPLLVFLVAMVFAPWGLLLIAANALALNGPDRWREVGFAGLAVAIYAASLAGLGALVRAGAVDARAATYVFVGCSGLSLVSASFAYVSQARTAELRRYLATGG